MYILSPWIWILPHDMLCQLDSNTLAASRLQKTCFSTTACECFLASLLDSERCMHQSSALQLHLSQVSPQRQLSDTQASQPQPAGPHSSRPALVKVLPVWTKR